MSVDWLVSVRVPAYFLRAGGFDFDSFSFLPHLGILANTCQIQLVLELRFIFVPAMTSA